MPRRTDEDTEPLLSSTYIDEDGKCIIIHQVKHVTLLDLFRFEMFIIFKLLIFWCVVDEYNTFIH